MRKMSSEVQVLDVDHRNVYVEAFLLLEMNRKEKLKENEDIEEEEAKPKMRRD